MFGCLFAHQDVRTLWTDKAEGMTRLECGRCGARSPVLSHSPWLDPWPMPGRWATGYDMAEERDQERHRLTVAARHERPR